MAVKFKDQSSLDRFLLENIKSGPTKLSDKTGLSKEQVAERIAHLLNEDSALEQLYSEALSLNQVNSQIDKIIEEYGSLDERNKAGMNNSFKNLITVRDTIFEKRSKRISEDIERLQGSHTEHFVEILWIFADHLVRSGKFENAQESVDFFREVEPQIRQAMTRHQVKEIGVSE